MSDSLRPHGLQCTRLSVLQCLSRVCSKSRPLSQKSYLAISSCATFFSFCLQSFPASGSFPKSWFFISDGQSIGARATVLPMNIQDSKRSINIGYMNEFMWLSSFPSEPGSPWFPVTIENFSTQLWPPIPICRLSPTLACHIQSGQK